MNMGIAGQLLFSINEVHVHVAPAPSLGTVILPAGLSSRNRGNLIMSDPCLH